MTHLLELFVGLFHQGLLGEGDQVVSESRDELVRGPLGENRL